MLTGSRQHRLSPRGSATARCGSWGRSRSIGPILVSVQPEPRWRQRRCSLDRPRLSLLVRLTPPPPPPAVSTGSGVYVWGH